MRTARYGPPSFPHICCDHAERLRTTRASRHRLRPTEPTVGITTPYHSTWLDNAKAKFLLGWRPRYDLKRMADEAWGYQRAADDPRVIWYPG